MARLLTGGRRRLFHEGLLLPMDQVFIALSDKKH